MFIRAADTDDGLTDDQAWLAGLANGLFGGLGDRIGIMTIDFDDLPAVALKASLGVIGKPTVDFAIDRDAIVIIIEDQLAQT